MTTSQRGGDESLLAGVAAVPRVKKSSSAASSSFCSLPVRIAMLTA
jgi:hypothetical protein